MLFFSRSMPSLPTVILALDKINQVFATIAANWLFPTRIRAAISMAKHMLNHYYNHTDYSEVYHIAMGEYNIICANVMCFKGDLVLHPLLKLNYFHRVGWESEWIETAQNIVQQEYDHSYKGQCDKVTSVPLGDHEPIMPVCIPY